MNEFVNNLIIPHNHNVVGTCSKCGGPIIQSILWAGIGEPTKYCMNCSKIVRQKINPTYGPILEVE